MDKLLEIKTRQNMYEENIVQLIRENSELKKELQNMAKLVEMKEKEISHFSKVQPIIDEMYKHFDETDPRMLLNQLKDAKDGSTYLLETIENNKRERVELIAKHDNDRRNLQNDIIALKGKINGLLAEIEDVKYVKENEISQLKSEVQSNLEYKQENIRLSQMLFTIYNALIERLSLEKEIKLSKDFSLIERDFKPDLFDNSEIKQYIKLMLLNSHDSTSSKVLREVIAYSNMILRKHFENAHVEGRFKPVKTFIMINEKLDDLCFENKKFKSQKKYYEDIVEGLKREIKKQEQIVKNKSGQIKLLEDKNNKKVLDNLKKQRQVNTKSKDKLKEEVRKSEIFITEDPKIKERPVTSRPESGFMTRQKYNETVYSRRLSSKPKQIKKEFDLSRIKEDNNKLIFAGSFNVLRQSSQKNLEELIKQTHKIAVYGDRIERKREETLGEKLKRKLETSTQRMDEIQKRKIDYEKLELKVENMKVTVG